MAYVTREELEAIVYNLVKRINANANVEVVVPNYQWTDQDSGSHTGDTDWQTIINETSGEGCAWVSINMGSYSGVGEVKVTIDGGSAITNIIYSAVNAAYCFPIQYTTSLKVEVRVNNSARIIYYDIWWSNS